MTEQETFLECVERQKEEARHAAFTLQRLLAPTLKEHNLCFSKEGDHNALIIIDPANPVFKMYVAMNKDKYTFSCSYSHQTTKITGTDSMGDPRWSSERYDFTHFFNRDEIIDLGGQYQSYREFFDFSRNSKIEKKEKLTLSDFMRVLTPYLKLVAAVTPKINAKIADENSDLALLNKLQAIAGDTQTKEYKRYRIHIGEYTIEPNGGSSCTVSRDMTLEEAIAEFTPSK